MSYMGGGSTKARARAYVIDPDGDRITDTFAWLRLTEERD